jgi:CRP-like cAMP-binding protein
VAWDKATMDHLIANHPPLARNLLRMTLERLEDIQTRYLELRTEMVEQRVARALLRIMQHAGRRTDDGILIDLPLSRQDLADYSGTTLYTVSRTLSAWEKRGWVRSGRERIVVAEPHALVLFSEKGQAGDY